MALLGFNYSKPGPGVGKDNAQKTAFSRFFEIFSRKFWDLIKINMLYFICIIIFYIPLSFSLFGIFNEKNYTQEFTNLYTFIYLLVCALPIALTGPFTAGYTYILRNFVREEHAFIWSDYKEVAKRNFKQSVLATLVNVIGFSLIVFNILYYNISAAKNPIVLLPMMLSSMAFVIFLFMNYYIYVMIVTFDLKLSQIYKNAFIFAVMGLGRNILVTIVLLVLIYAHWVFALPSLLLIPFISLSFAGLLLNFAVWPMIKKHMIDPYQQSDMQNEINIKQSLFKDAGKEKLQK
jgi:uncharacterized membrane protein YesL